MSVSTPGRRHNGAKKKTVSIPLNARDYQNQLPAIPWL